MGKSVIQKIEHTIKKFLFSESFMKPWIKKHEIYTFFILFLPFYFLFFFRLFVITSGQISFGNFTPPISLIQLDSIYHTFWNPYNYNAFLYYEPYITFLGFIYNGFLMLLWELFGLLLATKIFIFLSVLVLSLSFFQFVSRFSHNLFSKSVSTLFFSFNPIQIQLISFGGDFFAFFSESFLFIGLTLLIKSFQDVKFKSSKFALSLFLLVLSSYYAPFFYLGTALFIIFGIYYKYSMHIGTNKIKETLSFLLRFLLIIPIGLPFFYPILINFVSYSSTGGVALPINVLTANSISIQNILLLLAYPSGTEFTTLSILNNSFLFSLFYILLATLIVILLLSYFIVREKKIIYLLSVLIVAACLGAGPKGPIGFLTRSLYLYLPGYPILNGSYFWEWILISPFYSLIMLILLNGITNNRGQIIVTKRSPNKSVLDHLKIAKYGKIAIIMLIVAVILIPIVPQGYYSQGYGIHSNQLPPQYSQLPGILYNYTKGNYDSVAFLPPDGWEVLGNSTYGFNNPIFIDPNFRVALPPSYGSPNSNYSSYFYWVYRLFYENETRYLPELMGLAGVKYFVLLKDVKDGIYPYFSVYNNVNTSELLDYQYNLTTIYNTNSYTIYKSTLNLSTVNTYDNVTLLTGGYNEIATLANDGFNLETSNFLFNDQYDSYEIDSILGNSSYLITNGMSGVLSLAMDFGNIPKVNLFSNAEIKLNTSGWFDSNNLYYRAFIQGGEFPTVLFSSFSPYLVTFSKSSDSFSFSSNVAGDYVLWVKLLSSSYGGTLKFALNGKTTEQINSTQPISSSYNQFVWLSFPVHLQNGVNTLTIQSLSGINAISEITYAKPNVVNTTYSLFISFLRAHNINLISTQSADNIIVYQNDIFSPSQSYLWKNAGCYSTTWADLNSYNGLSVNFTISTPFSGGSVYARLSNVGGAYFDAQAGSLSTFFGLITGSGIFRPSETGYWVSLPLTIKNGITYVNLNELPDGGLFIDQIIYSSTSIILNTSNSYQVSQPVSVSPMSWVKIDHLNVTNTSNSQIRVDGVASFNTTRDPTGNHLLIYMSSPTVIPVNSRFEVIENGSPYVMTDVNNIFESGDNENVSETVPGVLLGSSVLSNFFIAVAINPVFAYLLETNLTFKFKFSLYIRIEGDLPANPLININNGVEKIPGSIRVTQNGLQIIGLPFEKKLLLRVQWFNQVTQLPLGEINFPAFGGLNTLIELNSSLSSTIKLSYVSEAPFYISLFVQSTSILAYSLIDFSLVKKRKNTYFP